MNLALFCPLCGGHHEMADCIYALTDEQRAEWRMKLAEFFPELLAIIDAQTAIALN